MTGPPTDVRPQVHTAVDVPRLRDRLREGWEAGHLHLILNITEAPCNFPVDVVGKRDGEDLVRPWSVDRWVGFLLEHLRDEELPLYYVTRDMTTLVAQAAAAMPHYQVYEDQLPSPAGLVVFGDTVCEVPPERLRPGQRVLVNAALWATVPDIGSGQPGVVVVTLQDTDVLLSTQPMNTSPKLMQQIIGEMRAAYGPLAYHEEYPLPFGDAPYGHTDQRVQNHAVAAMMTTWKLMRQRITITRDEPLPRAVRRQYTRDGRPVPVVRTTTLRQTVRTHQDPQEKDPNAPGRTYSVRWPVTGYGYWRNTWYPSKQRHEEQFVVVPSYMKGPPDAPIIGGDRVNVLRR